MKYENGGTEKMSQLSIYFMCFVEEVHKGVYWRLTYCTEQSSS